jgi:hypothetical protein
VCVEFECVVLMESRRCLAFSQELEGYIWQVHVVGAMIHGRYYGAMMHAFVSTMSDDDDDDVGQ